MFFYWTNIFKKLWFFTECTIFSNWFLKNYRFSLKKRFYWTNDYTVSSFNEKTDETDGKLTMVLRKNEIIFLNDWKKRTKWSEKNWTCPSRFPVLQFIDGLSIVCSIKVNKVCCAIFDKFWIKDQNMSMSKYINTDII